MEKFSVSVNIAGQSIVTFVLTYEELLQRKMGMYEILTRVKPKEPVQEFKVHCFVRGVQTFGLVGQIGCKSIEGGQEQMDEVEKYVIGCVKNLCLLSV